MGAHVAVEEVVDGGGVGVRTKELHGPTDLLRAEIVHDLREKPDFLLSYFSVKVHVAEHLHGGPHVEAVVERGVAKVVVSRKEKNA